MNHAGFSFVAFLALGCAAGTPPLTPRPDTGAHDVGTARDAGVDAHSPSDGGSDAQTSSDSSIDSGADVGVTTDGGADASVDAGTDGGLDAGRDAGPSCLISVGDTIVLDGTSDIAAYPASQLLAPGATLGPDDVLALTWDRDNLYVSVTSEAFLDAFAPFHLYLEARTTLGAAAPSRGKEYGGLTPELGFIPTHIVAVRRTSDSGSGPYNGVYVPGGTPLWSTRATGLDPLTHVFVSGDSRTISVRVPWSALGGCPNRLRLAAHVVRGDVGNEWKDVVPSTHTPWAAPGGGYFEIDLTTDPAVSGWTLR